MIKEFHYPTKGPGMMWDRFRAVVEGRGGRVQLNSEVSRIRLQGHHIKGLAVRLGDKTAEIGGDHFISSMPLGEMIPRLDPPPPPTASATAL